MTSSQLQWCCHLSAAFASVAAFRLLAVLCYDLPLLDRYMWRLKPGSHQAERSGTEGSGAEREKINPTKSVRRSGNSVNFKLAATGERSAKRCIILSIATHFIKLKRITNKQLVAAVTAS